jgi:hypothetical protein
MKKIILFLIIFLNINVLIAQPIKFNRMHRYNLSNTVPALNAVLPIEKQYICFGHFAPQPQRLSPIGVKFDSLGNVINWVPFIDSNYNYLLSNYNPEISTNDRGFIISGQACTNNPNPPNTYKGFLLKLDSNLNLQWRKYYYDSNPNSLWTYKDYTFLSLNTSLDKGFLATGYRYRNSGIATALVLKTDSMGNEEWIKTHLDNTFFSSYATSINLPSGGYVLGGGVDTNSNPINSDVVVIKTDSIGNIIWQKTFGGSKGDGSMMLQNHPDGSVMLFYTKSDSAVISQGNYDGYFTLQFHKLSPLTGDTIWSLSYGDKKHNQDTYSFKVFPDGSALASGSYGTYWTNPWLLKLSPEGSVEWYKEYSMTKPNNSNHFNGRILDLQQTDDKGFIICGSIVNFDTASYSFCWLMKIDSQGNWQDSATYIMPGIKLQASISLYPNPASSEVTATYFSDIEQGILEIYNTMGTKQMEVKLPKGQSSHKFSVAHLAKGYYKVILKEKGNIRGQVSLLITD